MDDNVGLGCKNCGSPDLEELAGGRVKCKYCGVIQRLVDSQDYFKQLQTEVMAWARESLPMGMNLQQVENVDLIARHNIFTNNVKPVIESLYNEYKFGFTGLLSNQFIALPFRMLPVDNVRHTPKDLFEFNAKVHAVEPLAVDETGKELLKEASSISMSYAMMLNNVTLLERDEPDRYFLMDNNFKSSIEQIDHLANFELVKQRFMGLESAAYGLDLLLNNNPQEAAASLHHALDILNEVKSEVCSSIDFGSMVTGISKELTVCQSAIRIAEVLKASPDVNSADLLLPIKNTIDELDREESAYQGVWTPLMKRMERYSDIFSSLSDAISAKNGNKTVMIADGTGNCLLPMWLVSVEYSFETGSLFKKKSVKVDESVLVPATFTTSNNIMKNPRSGITDIFATMPETTFIQRAKGNETSISMGGLVSDIVKCCGARHPSNNSEVIIPTSTKLDVELLCTQYLDQCKATHPKLRMGKPTANQLIYVPIDINGTDFTFKVPLDNLSPSSIGDMRVINGLRV